MKTVTSTLVATVVAVVTSSTASASTKYASVIGFNSDGGVCALQLGTTPAGSGAPLSLGYFLYGTVEDVPADVNGDGLIDLVEWNPTNQGPILGGVGPTFTQYYPTSGTYGNVANVAGDVNGDGKADLVAWSQTEIKVMLSTGTGFGAPQSWFSGGSFYGDVANLIGDVNGDGKADLVGWRTDSIWVMYSTGSLFGYITLAMQNPPVGNVTHIVADMNNDKKADFVAWSSNQVVQAQFGGSYQQISTAAAGGRGNMVLDVNQDGWGDLVRVNTNDIWVELENTGLGNRQWTTSSCWGTRTLGGFTAR